MSVNITEGGKKVTFGFRCPVCDQKWIADATDCMSVCVDDEFVPIADMTCENCGYICQSVNFLKEDK